MEDYFEAMCEIENDKYGTKNTMFFRAFDEAAKKLHRNTGAGKID